MTVRSTPWEKRLTKSRGTLLWLAFEFWRASLVFFRNASSSCTYNCTNILRVIVLLIVLIYAVAKKAKRKRSIQESIRCNDYDIEIKCFLARNRRTFHKRPDTRLKSGKPCVSQRLYWHSPGESTGKCHGAYRFKQGSKLSCKWP